MPFLETMRLTALGDSGRSIQWLISSCPRLADLTLEALWNLERVCVLNKPLHRFAIRCCHNLKYVDIDASKLRSLEYRGRGPSESFLSLHGSPPVTIPLWCTIGFCKPLSEDAEFARLTRFFEEISNTTKHLCLHHGSLGSGFFQAAGLFPLFSSLTRLMLQGCIGNSDTVVAVGRIMEQTPNLEVLSLLMWEPQKGKDEMTRDVVFDEITEPIFALPCLRTRVREICVEDYEGSAPEEMLVKLLLRNALVLEKLQVVFTEWLSSEQKDRLEVQMRRWGVANSEKVFMQLGRMTYHLSIMK
uniref:Uncharacterized protein n=1 Tax=Avena sativa TaxID=4498 RepID=A0ACD5Z8J2_AVESA